MCGLLGKCYKRSAANVTVDGLSEDMQEPAAREVVDLRSREHMCVAEYVQSTLLPLAHLLLSPTARHEVLCQAAS